MTRVLIGEGNKTIARQENADGFTIVELIVVIVVIAILSVISLVVYTGIQQRARESRVQSQLVQLRRSIEANVVETGRYPFEDEVRSIIAQPGYPDADGYRGTLGDDAAWEIVAYIREQGGSSGSSGTSSFSYSTVNPSLAPDNHLRWCAGIGVRNSNSDITKYLFISSKDTSVTSSCPAVSQL